MIAGVGQSEQPLPFGIQDLDPNVTVENPSSKRVVCYVKGCRQVLQVPCRGTPGEVCPDHGIRCHHSSAGGTYTYADVRNNAIVSPDLLAKRIVGHPFKYESHRLGAERSEDMLSWNVFRSLQEAGCLHKIGELITGDRSGIEPFLYLWGICLTDDDLTPWGLLIDARKRFESNLPVDRPLTEPDIALHLPGRYLVLIEAKFTSPNTFYTRGPRKNDSSLTVEELLDIYSDRVLRTLDCSVARKRDRIPHQLWRNTVFSEWMAYMDHPRTKPYHVNLVRSGFERESAQEFGSMVRPGVRDCFQRITWEQIFCWCVGEPKLARLRRYLDAKTAGLTKAFRINSILSQVGETFTRR